MSNYWQERAKSRLVRAEQIGLEAMNKTLPIYDQALKNINKEINSIYINYSNKVGLDVSELTKILSGADKNNFLRNIQLKMKISLLKDRFKDLDPRIWNFSGSDPISFSSSGVTFDGHVFMYTLLTNPYDLIGSSVFIELKDLSLPNIDDEVEILSVDNGTWYTVGIRNVGGTLKLFMYESNGGTYSYGDTYNSSVHKYFRIRESGGTVYFECSSDLKTWANIVDPDTEPTVDVSEVVLYIGSFDTSASITLDNLNISNTPIINRKYPIVSFKQE